MFFAKRKNKTRRRQGYGRASKKFNLSHDTRQGIYVILLLLISVVMAVSFFGSAGKAGIVVNMVFTKLIGHSKWAIPFILFLFALGLGKIEKKNFNSTNIIGLFLFILSFSSLSYFYTLKSGGGYLGMLAVEWALPIIGPMLLAIIFSSFLILSLLLVLDTSLNRLFGEESLIFKLAVVILGIIFYPFIRKDFDDESASARGYGEAREDEEDEEHEEEHNDGKAVVKEYEVEEHDEDEKKENKSKNFSWSKSNIEMNIPLALLKSKPKKPTSGNIDRNQDTIKKTLLDFGVPVHMGEVRVGPTVTQYTFKPSKGISVSRVKALSDDLALNLAVHPVRIEAPIPGKSLVGLEVPNQTKVMVALKETLQSKKFKNRKSNMMVSLGRDVTGQVWLDDLAKMPHLLVAGSTGSGKSVCLHSLITALLYQNNPDDLKMILIDVKQVELTVYDDLPYLVAPVVTDTKRAIRSLQWCLGEMDRRLEKLKEAKCQNIQEYNKKKKGRMPYMVVVVDELGDLMSTSKKEVEGSIIRLGQKSRAAGIHLILATQRPSVDILSGLIKANMPARIAFSVTSSVNSKTILDFTGAEKLLGQGDMLYVNSSLSKPVRIQGAYVDKGEVRAVVKYAKKKAGKAKFIEEITEKTQGSFNYENDENDDDLMSEAKQLIIDSGKASAAMLQSRLSIGYPRANRILDNLEKQGMVGPSIQNKPREVYAC
ncbi:MAG: DNA translocase FtsK [Alphaproteobacteria bacterium]